MMSWSIIAAGLILVPICAMATPVKPGVIGLHRNPDFVDVYYDSDRRERLICESARYRAVADIVRPSLIQFGPPGGGNLLEAAGLWMELEDARGVRYSSRLAPRAARQNTWRAGPHYYDAHLLDFELAAEDGRVAPVRGEFVLNCFPDKVSLQAIFHVKEDVEVSRAEILCETAGTQPAGSAAEGLALLTGAAAVLGLAGAGEGVELKAEGKTVRIACPGGEWKAGESHESHVALFCGAQDSVESVRRAALAELTPLDERAFTLAGATFGGYDYGRGLYVVRAVPGHSGYGFEGFWNNPNMYLTVDVAVRNNGMSRRIYLMHDCPAGPIEAAVLTDIHGFPLPVQVQACKNFGGENEEPIDVHFSESYYPLDLAPRENRRFLSHHLHQDWGDHPLRQVSSIRFFQIYYHLSQGVTETTCFSLPTKFGTIPGGAQRAYTVADYRPLSGQTWIGQPQHEHVGLQGWLQYDDGEAWRWPRFRGSTVLSTGPNLAWFIQDYESSDGKVDETVEVFEMPQEDELRTFLRIRYDFKQDVTIAGDPRHNLRLLNKGTYIRRVHWKELAWVGESGEVETKALTYDGKWSAEGESMRPVNSFACAYPHIDGSDSVVVRSFRGEVGGRPFSRLGFSAIGHENHMTELMLVPLIDGNTVPAGSWFELDCILVPYGDDFSTYNVPLEESVRFGLNAREMAEFLTPEQTEAAGITVMGPAVDVTRGERILDLPPVVKAEDNWAEFTFSGGHDRIALVATGFRAPKLPMLWEGSTYIDQQSRGGDGYQAFANADGTYGFVFAPRTRTTRHANKWQTTTHRYLVTQAVSQADIASVMTANGEVVLAVQGKGETVIDSPRIWCPASNVLRRSRSVHEATSSARQIMTVPVRLAGDWTEAKLTVEAYEHKRFRMRVSADAEAVLQTDGMVPDRSYEVSIGDEELQLSTSAGGRLDVRVPAGQDVEVRGRPL
jgi:hypothetical protein